MVKVFFKNNDYAITKSLYHCGTEKSNFSEEKITLANKD